MNNSIADKLERIARNEQLIYNAGVEKGKREAGDERYEQGFAAGRAEGYDEGLSDSPATALAKEVIERTITEITPSDIDALGLTRVGWHSFSRCDKLKKFISTNEQNISVSNAAFDNCTSLIEAHIGLVVGSSAFSGCSQLQKVVIYGNAQFPWGVFKDCKSLKVIDCRNATTIPSISANASAFDNVPDGCQFVVPDHLYDEWSVATNWVSYENIIITKASDYTEYEVIE